MTAQQNSNKARLLKSLTLCNILSFAPDTPPFELRSLNVLIGPNGSGKSNVLDAISLLRGCPTDVRRVIRQGGGVKEWIWKGEPDAPASLDAIVAYPGGKQPLRHHFAFRVEQQAFRIQEERIEDEHPRGGEDDPYFYYRYQHGRPYINLAEGGKRRLEAANIDPDQSLLAQRKDPEAWPEVTYLGKAYAGIRLYREWTFGRSTPLRQPQRIDLQNDYLEEDFSNLGLFLNRLRQHPKVKAELLEHLRDLYEGLTDFDVSIIGGTVQVFFTEGDFAIPVTRLSDGSLRYLCLLAILLDPNPPPLICIEEPELGLHPDLLPKVADLLIAASERTQLVITTHSDILVDAFTDHAEAIIVCERHEDRTSLQRLNPDDLAVWLGKYRLGELWTKGELGGTRW